MKNTHRILLTLAAAASLSSLSELARSHETHAHPSKAAEATQTASEWTAAEIRRIDGPNRKLTLKHAEIKHLDMPAMTMVFSIKPDAEGADLTPQLKVGDKIMFRAESSQGKIWISALKRP
ncbi:copper-binding protein [Roseateles sp.]|uniref:copper-binding protein n=1 Tax=Roseateles sp. TaxID=1971397 RepID=UPI003BA4FB29